MKKPYKIVAINGSHRSQKGISEILLQTFLEGAQMNGVECDVFYPSKMDIAPCRACHKCILKTPGRCFYQDDMSHLLDKIEEADLMVWAAPVYFDTAPSNMQKMFERLMPMYGTRFEFKDGRSYHPTRSGKKHNVVSILLCGNPERKSLECLSTSFRRIIANMDGCLKGEFLFPSSYLFELQPELTAEQRKALTIAGQEIARDNCISPETAAAVNKEYIDDPAAIVEMKNKFFEDKKI